MLLRCTGLHGVFTGAHAIAEGRLARRQLREGPHVRVLHGVHADPSLPRDHLLRCRAASLLMPAGAALGGRSAAALLGAPEPSYGDVIHDGTWQARVDLAWPEAGVVVEYEGDHRFEGLRIARDDVRLQRLVAAGWTVIRLSAADLRSMDDVVGRIGEALGVVPRSA